MALSHLMTKPKKWHVHPARTQISMGIRPVYSESSLCTQREAKDPSFLHADSKDSDQTEQTPRLIWDFAGCTCHFVGFVMRRLRLKYTYLLVQTPYKSSTNANDKFNSRNMNRFREVFSDKINLKIQQNSCNFRTDKSGQTVQTQIRLLLEAQSDQRLHCLPFRLHRLNSLLYGRAT